MRAGVENSLSFYLHEEGETPSEVLASLCSRKANRKDQSGNFYLAIIGDDIGFDRSHRGENGENVLEDFGVMRMSLGKTSLLSSHCIIVAHHYIDTLG